MIVTTDKCRLSAIERLEHALARIYSADARSRAAFTTVFEDSARREAKASDDRAVTGATRKPLDGRIVSVKALFDVAGTVTSSGSAVLRGLPRSRRNGASVPRRSRIFA